MSDISKLLEKFREGSASWTEFAEFLALAPEKLEPFFKLAREITEQNFGKVLKIYIPNVRFHAISVTGSDCALKCAHCSQKYLDGMKAITTNSALEEHLINHYKNGGIGVLLSGGCESDGSVPLLDFLDTVKSF